MSKFFRTVFVTFAILLMVTIAFLGLPETLRLTDRLMASLVAHYRAPMESFVTSVFPPARQLTEEEKMSRRNLVAEELARFQPFRDVQLTDPVELSADRVAEAELAGDAEAHEVSRDQDAETTITGLVVTEILADQRPETPVTEPEETPVETPAPAQTPVVGEPVHLAPASPSSDLPPVATTRPLRPVEQVAPVEPLTPHVQTGKPRSRRGIPAYYVTIDSPERLHRYFLLSANVDGDSYTAVLRPEVPENYFFIFSPYFAVTVTADGQTSVPRDISARTRGTITVAAAVD